MNRSTWLTDELIQAAFERRAGRAAHGDLRETILTLSSATSQRAAWRLRLASSLSRPVLRPAWVALLVLAALLGIALAVVLVGQRPQSPFRAGLLAYSQDGDVYLANADGSGAIKVLHDAGVVFSAPTWSPDDRWLALQGSGAVFILDPGTLELRRVASGEGAVWSSDGRSLAFVRSSASGTALIEIFEVGTGALRDLQPKLATGASLGLPLAWSPDGRGFLATTYASNGNRFVRIDAATGDTVDIAPMPHLSEPGAHWSPDSQRFAYARPDACDQPPCRTAIVVADADLSHAIAISDPAKVSSNPIWSPDGAWIAFTSATWPNPSASTLWIVRPDGRYLRALVETGAFSAYSWSADGAAVDFSRFDPVTGVGLGVFEVRISDGALRSIDLAPGLTGYDLQAIPAERPVPRLPNPPSPASPALESTAPLPSPPAALSADPSGSWSGIAVDGYCDAGILDFRTLTPRIVGSQCPESNGTVVFAPQGAAYAASELDASVSVVRSDGPTTNVLEALGVPPPGVLSQVDMAWSPDGRWLSVHRCIQDAHGDCVDPAYIVVSAGGRSLQRLPATPSWSPDGRRLVIKGENGDLLVGSPDGSDLRSIGNFPLPSSWSPDATQFAFVRDGDAWIVNADGTDEKNATNFASGGVFDAIWSPDGRFIAVIQESQLQILRLDGGDLLPIDLGRGRTSFFGLSWSPDSTRLAVVVGPGDSPATLIVRTEDWTATALRGEVIDSVAWSPDGRFIALMSRSSGFSAIDIANADGSGRHTIWTGPDSWTRITWVQ